MNTLNEQNAAALLERFYDFGDGIFRRISISLDNTVISEYTAVIDLEALDSEEDGRRVPVRFTIHKLREYRLERIPLVVFELNVAFFDERVYLDFDSKGLPQSAEDVRRSSFYLAAVDCTWEILPHKE